MIPRIKWRAVVVVVLTALIVIGCGTDTNNQLKPPSVYRGPQVRVTHAPTETAVSSTEASSSAIVEPTAIQLWDGPTVDEAQALMDDIDYLLDKIERNLDQTNVNP